MNEGKGHIICKDTSLQGTKQQLSDYNVSCIKRGRTTRSGWRQADMREPMHHARGLNIGLYFIGNWEFKWSQEILLQVFSSYILWFFDNQLYENAYKCSCLVRASLLSPIIVGNFHGDCACWWKHRLNINNLHVLFLSPHILHMSFSWYMLMITVATWKTTRFFHLSI